MPDETPAIKVATEASGGSLLIKACCKVCYNVITVAGLGDLALDIMEKSNIKESKEVGREPKEGHVSVDNFLWKTTQSSMILSGEPKHSVEFTDILVSEH